MWLSIVGVVFFSNGVPKGALWEIALLARALLVPVLKAFLVAVLRALFETVLKRLFGAVLRVFVEAAGNEAAHFEVELPSGHSPESTAEGQGDPDKQTRHSKPPVSQTSASFEGDFVFAAPSLRVSATAASFFTSLQPPAAEMTPRRSMRREAAAVLRIVVTLGVRIIAVALAAMRVP